MEFLFSLLIRLNVSKRVSDIERSLLSPCTNCKEHFTFKNHVHFVQTHNLTATGLQNFHCKSMNKDTVYPTSALGVASAASASTSAATSAASHSVEAAWASPAASHSAEAASASASAASASASAAENTDHPSSTTAPPESTCPTKK